VWCKYFIGKALWATLYLSIVVAPVFILLIGDIPPARGLLWEFSSAMGFATACIMGMQFAITARFKKATAPFGIDIIYHFHKYIGITILAFIIFHPAAILLSNPSMAFMLDPITAPAVFKSGMVSAFSVLLIVTLTLLRKRLNFEYDYWRLFHIIFSVIAVIAAIIHISDIGYYTHAVWKKTLWGGLAAIWLYLALFVRLVKPILVIKRPYVLEQLRKERGDNWTIRLKTDGHKGIDFVPGQFAWISIWHSPFALKEHPFSITSSAELASTLEFTIKERGDFTKRIKTLTPGERIYVDAPYGSFSFVKYPAEGYIFFAGGIGIAPIMSMLRTLADRGDRRPLLLFYANKQWERAAFREEIDALTGRLNLSVVHVLENPHKGWDGERGYISADIINKYIPAWRDSRECFICGPVPMIESIEKALRKLRVPLTKFHSEIFEIV